jgi:hypothetical protein
MGGSSDDLGHLQAEPAAAVNQLMVLAVDETLVQAFDAE